MIIGGSLPYRTYSNTITFHHSLTGLTVCEAVFYPICELFFAMYPALILLQHVKMNTAKKTDRSEHSDRAGR